MSCGNPATAPGFWHDSGLLHPVAKTGLHSYYWCNKTACMDKVQSLAPFHVKSAYTMRPRPKHNPYIRPNEIKFTHKKPGYEIIGDIAKKMHASWYAKTGKGYIGLEKVMVLFSLPPNSMYVVLGGTSILCKTNNLTDAESVAGSSGVIVYRGT